MNLTRRQALKSLVAISAVAALPPVVPAIAKAMDTPLKPKAAVSYTPTTEDLLDQIDTLLNLISAERGEPYDHRKDHIDITFPCGSNEHEVAEHFIESHPYARWYGSFNSFQSWKCLLVRVNRFENPGYDGRDNTMDSRNEFWARMFYTKGAGICTAGRSTFYPPTMEHRPTSPVEV